MNISKHMEAIFVAATVVLCSYAYQADSAVESDAVSAIVTEVAAQQNSSSEQAAVQTVVITAKRG